MSYYICGLANYSQPERFYHNLQHVADCIRLIERDFGQRLDIIYYDELIFAALYHDCIYVPGAANNEAASADLASRHLSNSHANFWMVRKIIMATQHLGKPLETIEERIMADVDLAGLGADVEQYKANSQLIELEHRFGGRFTQAAFREGRLRWLEMMLARPRLYYTDLYFEKHEQQARRNMAAELADLHGETKE